MPLISCICYAKSGDKILSIGLPIPNLGTRQNTSRLQQLVRYRNEIVGGVKQASALTHERGHASPQIVTSDPSVIVIVTLQRGR